jgi:Rrf2 family protein
MRLALGKRGDYGVRATLYLARIFGEGRRKAREIARAMDVPERFLPQIMTDLIRAGLVTSVAGPDGGYELARAPEEISLLDVIEGAEGPARSERCVLRGGPCHWDNACAVHAAWFRAQNALIESMRETTFAELAEVDASLEAGLGLPDGSAPANEPSD